MSTTTSPNILFILVDEMRYPTHFPQGVSSVDQFLQRSSVRGGSTLQMGTTIIA